MTGHHDHEHEENLDAVWKGLTALSGVYFMFLIEHFLTLGKMYKEKKQKVRDGEFLSQSGRLTLLIPVVRADMMMRLRSRCVKLTV